MVRGQVMNKNRAKGACVCKDHNETRLSVKREKTLLFISLNLNEIKHFLICLLAIRISSVHYLYSSLTFTVPKGVCQSIR